MMVLGGDAPDVIERNLIKLCRSSDLLTLTACFLATPVAAQTGNGKGK
jgi:hypothetical protein